jgi:hypothetical protein
LRYQVESEDDIIDEHNAQYDAVRDEVYDDFVDEVVSEAGSLAEELPLTTGGSDERFIAARPQSRISSVSPHFCRALVDGIIVPKIIFPLPLVMVKATMRRFNLCVLFSVVRLMQQ